jgi:NTP pyrophosphatase (non-canonical NTP hydrolase)
MMDAFEQLKLAKLKQVARKHVNDPLDFNNCLEHLKQEFKELNDAVEEGDEGHITEELADLANCCKFVFLALVKKRGSG